MGKPSRSEGIYEDLRKEVLAGRVRPGQKVDIEALANKYEFSTQPIRLLVNRMIGERVVEVTPHDGFMIPAAKERRIREVHKWNKRILLMAIEIAMREETDPEFPPLDLSEDDIVTATEALFLAIAAFSDMDETKYAVANVNDRLRPIRQLDTGTLIDHPAELKAFQDAWDAHDLKLLRRLVTKYHHKRLRLVTEFVALAYGQ
ncbi:MAG: GntR family transcriptional regulator [Asticcacaulis sp.]|uniref:GntR family transcriptional regulator n=1 Tax=Asticcacaulis sp. TaxID=1872648 RepID=UPI0039E2D113